MTFVELRLPGAYIVELEMKEDDRGFFMRTWCEEEFAARRLAARMAQASTAVNRQRGTLRGMHYQAAPWGEVKLVRCVRGSIYDVIIDLRPTSPTYKHWVATELTGENARMLYVPEGFAHGYLTLAEDTEVAYQMSQVYVPEAGRGVRYDDPAFAIPWPEAVRVISDRDRSWPDHRD
jgi:dTDP-4-dehydrorhamnose 3,5-epimerase